MLCKCYILVCSCLWHVIILHRIYYCYFRGSPPLILRTVHELQSFQSRDLHLLVPSVLSTLLESHIASLTPSPLTATYHCTCWEYDHPSTSNQELDQKQSKGLFMCNYPILTLVCVSVLYCLDTCFQVISSLIMYIVNLSG